MEATTACGLPPTRAQIRVATLRLKLWSGSRRASVFTNPRQSRDFRALFVPIIDPFSGIHFFFCHTWGTLTGYRVWRWMMSSPQTDSQETKRLLERAAAGDRRAFDRLFELHRPSLRRLISL